MDKLKQAAAFVEYVLRHMSEDIKEIISELKALGFPISEEIVKYVVRKCLVTHIVLEIIKWATYLSITWMVCKTVIRVVPCM